MLVFALVLTAAFVAARTCGATKQDVTKEEAIEIARENAAFEPCPEQRCVQVRYVQRGIPVQTFWAVVLSDELDAEGRPNRVESLLIDTTSGDVSRP